MFKSESDITQADRQTAVLIPIFRCLLIIFILGSASWEVLKWGHVNMLVTFSNPKYCTYNCSKNLTHIAILKPGLIMQHQGLFDLSLCTPRLSLHIRRLHTITSVLYVFFPFLVFNSVNGKHLQTMLDVNRIFYQLILSFFSLPFWL